LWLTCALRVFTLAQMPRPSSDAIAALSCELERADQLMLALAALDRRAAKFAPAHRRQKAKSAKPAKAADTAK